METWGWPGVSFHEGPLQTQNLGQRSRPAITALPVSAPPTSLVTVPELSLVHPGANHCGQEKRSVFIGLSWHKWGQTLPSRWGPASPAGIMTDKAVAEADLMTLPPVREGRFSAAGSPDSC